MTAEELIIGAEITRRRFQDYYDKHPLDSIGRKIDRERMASYHVSTELEFARCRPYTA